MDGKVGKVSYLNTGFIGLESAIKPAQSIEEARLSQAHLLALMSLETKNLGPDEVVAALKIADRYMSELRGCIQIVGGTNLETIATFPDGKVTIDKLSQ